MKKDTWTLYKLTNTITGKSYVGKSLDHRFHKRMIYHKCAPGTSRYLHSSIKKHGWDKFKIVIMMQGVCDVDIDRFEQNHIFLWQTIVPLGYNLTLGGDGFIPSDETRKLLSDANKGEKNHFYGRKHTKKSIDQMIETKKSVYKFKNHPSLRKDLYNNADKLYEYFMKTGTYKSVARKFRCSHRSAKTHIIKYAKDNELPLFSRDEKKRKEHEACSTPKEKQKHYRWDLRDRNKELYECFVKEGSYSAVARMFNTSWPTAKTVINEYIKQEKIECQEQEKI